MNRLAVRLSLAFLFSAWIGIGAMVLVVQRTIDTGFRQYLITRDSETNPDQVARLEDYFASTGSWAGAESVFSARGGSGSSSGGGTGRGATLSVADMNGVVVASTDPTQIGTQLTADTLATALKLMGNSDQVGWLLRKSPGVEALGVAEIAFLEEANRWLTIASVGATVLALVVGSLLAWTLARPLRELTVAARDLTVGQLGRQVRARGSVEVEALAVEFNKMSSALAETEALRQRMAADVAHELRTPVSILRGHLEAMLDGIYPLDSAHVAVAHDQTIHLARLVEDLRVLTLAEARQLPLERAAVDPAALVKQMLDMFEPLAADSEISLSDTVAPNLPAVYADPTRVRQVLSNLLSNALRYTPAGGAISVEVSRTNGQVGFSVANSGSGLIEIDAARVFQPFWRATAAREQYRSGSGLGLAISREIIQLHGGTITVETSPERVVFRFTLPVVTS